MFLSKFFEAQKAHDNQEHPQYYDKDLTEVVYIVNETRIQKASKDYPQSMIKNGDIYKRIYQRGFLQDYKIEDMETVKNGLPYDHFVVIKRQAISKPEAV